MGTSKKSIGATSYSSPDPIAHPVAGLQPLQFVLIPQSQVLKALTTPRSPAWGSQTCPFTLILRAILTPLVSLVHLFTLLGSVLWLLTACVAFISRRCHCVPPQRRWLFWGHCYHLHVKQVWMQGFLPLVRNVRTFPPPLGMLVGSALIWQPKVLFPGSGACWGSPDTNHSHCVRFW